MSKKILILGAGYSGIRVASLLRKCNEDIDVYLIDKKNYHTEKTCLHEVATGQVEPSKISYSIVDCIGNKVKFLQDTIKKIDKDNKKVILEKNGEKCYDYLVISLGFESETFGIKGVNENALQMVDLDDAIKIRKHIEKELEAYKNDKDPKHLVFSVIGAGFTGVELVGSLSEMMVKYSKEYGFDINQVKINCVEAATELLPMFSRKLANYAIDYLTKNGVNFITGAAVNEIKEGVVVYKKEDEIVELPSNTIVWTTGVSGVSLICESGFCARRGRVIVKPDLTIDGHDDIFMLGDVSAVVDPSNNRPYPTTAQISLCMADICVKNLIKKVRGDKNMLTFNYKSKGTVCSLGNTNAIASVGTKELKGYPASVLKKIITTRSLHLGSRRLSIMFAKGRYDLYR